MTKQEILDNLNKEGVTDLDSLADMIVKKSNPAGDENAAVTNSILIYSHGFVAS